jgi:uncharacterized membrane protein YphA (DoxX/SURF4 family)
MSFSQSAGTAFVPTLARLVLAAAFITSGWNKLMTTQDFTGNEAQRLIELRVVSAEYDRAPSVRLASFTSQSVMAQDPQPSQDPPATDPPAADPPQKPEGTTPPAKESLKEAGEHLKEAAKDVKQGVQDAVKDIPTPPKDEVITPPGSGDAVVKAKRMHIVTLLLDQKGWPQPTVFAWVATLTELVGGSLLLLGLFSRLWGLLLAGALCVWFYLTSFDALQMKGWSLFNLTVPEYNRLFCQAGLFVLALGIFLTGPGPLSLDRLLFRPTPRIADDDD